MEQIENNEIKSLKENINVKRTITQNLSISANILEKSTEVKNRDVYWAVGANPNTPSKFAKNKNEAIVKNSEYIPIYGSEIGKK